MSDAPHNGGASSRRQILEGDEQQLPYAAHVASAYPHAGSTRQGGAAPFHAQMSSVTSHQHRSDQPRVVSQHGPPAFNNVPVQQQSGQAFNMGAMSGALPEYGMGNLSPGGQKAQYQQPPPRVADGTPPGAMYQNMQYPLPAGNLYQGSAAGYSGYGQGQYTSPYGSQTGTHQQNYPPFALTQPRVNTMQQQMPPYQQMPSPYYYMQGGYGGQSPHSPHGGQYNPALVGRSGFTTDQDGRLHQSDSTSSTIPRGPPRKPKQSGHALWVGNLPPGATVLDLKDHFSREATRDIESLFLISKSNCAFVNYRTEAACTAAMQRFHDSRFQGVRLVCRLRRTSTAAPGVPSGPAASTGPRKPVQASPPGSPTEEAAELVEEEALEPDAQSNKTPQSSQPTGSGSQRAAEKFFIIKSLTLQDLEQSVRNGIWATQAHNEEILNKAFESADNVYLIFSANKSGEYFGYARMLSPISNDGTEIYESAPQPQAIEPTNAPRTIPTPATETAPKGRIIDDSARGTIFWEAELSESEEVDGDIPAETPISEAVDGQQMDGSGSQAYGKPFKVEWLSTNRLPFYRTRGLRNPWNANRDVKIARDGTELEPTVGRKLAQMFHRAAPSPISPTGGVGQMPGFAGPSVMRQHPYGPQ